MTHLAKKGDTGATSTGRFYKEDVNGTIIVSDNYQNEPTSQGEGRDAPMIKSSDQVPADIFTNSGNSNVNMKTPAEQGQTIRKRSGPVTWQEVHDQ